MSQTKAQLIDPVDGTIVNADINASAAIAGTKISPDFGSQNITTSGNITAGDITANGGDLTVSGTTAVIHLTDTNNDDDFSLMNENGNFRIRDATNSLNRLNIDSSGTVNVTGNLDVGAGIDVTGAITSTGNYTITNTQPKIFLTDSNSDSDYSIQNENGNFNIFDETNSTSRVRIISTGKVGIGTTSPNRTLTVQSNGGQMSINDTDNTNGGIFCNAGLFSFYARGNSNLGDGSTGGVFEVQTHEAGGSTSQKFRIDGVGKLSTGGETAPDVSAGGICLNQGSESANAISCKSSDINHGRTSVDETDTWFSVRKVSDNKGGAFIHGYTDQSGGDPGIHIAGYIDSQAPSFRAIQLTGARKNTSNTGSSPFSSGNPIVRISNDFDTTVASFTPDGLAFNDDTAASNSLGDYEEGTWIPSIVNGGSPSYSQQSGLYTKIGNLVTHTFVMSFSGASLSTSSRIQGLPFAYNSTFETSTNMGRIGTHWNDAESAGNRFCHAVGHTGQGTTRIYVDLLTSGTDKTLRGFFQMRVP